MGDVLFVIAFLGLMVGPFIYYGIKGRKGFWFWVGTISSMGICLGVGELSSKMVTGKTLSSNFWAFSLDDWTGAVITLSCMAVAWALLIVHLSWKKIRQAQTK